MDEDSWHQLLSRLLSEIGAFETMAVYERLHANPVGFMLLLIQNGDPVGFVKLEPKDGSSLQAEASALRAVVRFKPSSYYVPEPIAVGNCGEWEFLTMTALRAKPHRVATNPPIKNIVREIQAALSVLTRPPDTPAHWQPMHGDLAPWNLRQQVDGGFVILDWARAGYGPPGADEVFYQAGAASIGIKPAGSCVEQEAIEFWMVRVSESKQDSKRDRRFASSMLRSLDQMYIRR